jgi:demethylmenaquinone methyltransferase/2-methoxy-6-polyprenyl-1,4-benzoquinol methylase
MGNREKREYVREMFTSIAPRYDFLNHLLSLNIDKSWRRAAVDALAWEAKPTGRFLDLCSGTMDLTAELACRAEFRGQVIGADFVIPMLKLGRKKMPLPAVGADALSTPFPDEAFDGCTVGFGVRNLTDLSAGITEMHRLLRPGARMVILEFCTPEFLPMRVAYLSYFKVVLPVIGRLVSKHDSAYSYLPESVLNFPSPDELSEAIRSLGFKDVGHRRLAMGIAAVHWGTKR